MGTTAMAKRRGWGRALVVCVLMQVSLAGAAETLTVKGSDTMVILGQRWAESFMKANPSAKLQVTGGGSGVGLAALSNGTTHIAMSSRHIKKPESERLRARVGAAPTEIAVAKDAVAFFVNEHNPVRALTLKQLRDIYLGDLTNWKQVGGPDATIVLYSRENSSGTYVFVKDELLGGQDFPAEAQTLPGTAAVVSAVSKEKYGIGYGGVAYGRRIRPLKIRSDDGTNEVQANAETVANGRYPLSRDLFFYLREKPEGLAGRFVDYVLSVEGQGLIEGLGYFRLNPAAGATR